MASNPAEERRRAHAYLDRLPASQISVVRSLLELILDPASKIDSDAAMEDEEISREEERAAADAREWLKHHNPISNEELLAEFDLTLDDFERMGRTPLPTESDAEL